MKKGYNFFPIPKSQFSCINAINNAERFNRWTASLELNGSEIDLEIYSRAEINVLSNVRSNKLSQWPKVKSMTDK